MALIDFLIAHKSEAGDGLNFKASVWTAATAHMQPVTTKGGPKHADKCKAKWGRVHTKKFDYTDFSSNLSVALIYIPSCHTPQEFIWT